MKKLFLLCLLTLVTSFAASAYEWTDANGTVWSFIVDGNNAILEEDEETACVDGTIPEDLIIPAFVYRGELSYTVTSIGKYAFYCCYALTSVTIPSSVTSIDGYAFYGCSALTSVTIPNTVTYIDERAFAGCSALTSVNIPSSVMGIGPCAFLDCSSLTSVTIPSSVTAIGNEAFMGCSSLTNIYVDSGNGRYDSRGNCNAIIETATNTLLFGCKNTTIPSSVTIIGNYAFWYCSGLTSVTIPSSVIYIGHFAFDGCSDLTSVTIPSSVRGIDIGAFQGCSGLTSVTIPSSLTNIGYGAFEYCSGLTSVYVDSGNGIYDSRDNCNAIIETATNTLVAGCKNTIIPSSVTSIGDWAFNGCSGLTSVTIPSSVTSIGDYAFEGCSGLTDIAIPNSVTSIGRYAFENTAWYEDRPNGVVYAGRVAYKYKGTMPANSSIVLKDGTLGIAKNAFFACRDLVSIAIPNSVTRIGDGAFQHCSGLTSITIPNSVTSIGIGTFFDCTGLFSINIPNSVTSIGDNAFHNCSGLASITIPNSVSSIGYYVFENTVWYDNQPNGVVYAGKVAYKYKGTMPANSSIVLKDGTLGIAKHAFRNCTGLTSVTIPNSVTNIGEYAFQGCNGLTSVVIPSSITSIGLSAFHGCSGLTSVSIPNSVTSIGNSAFYNCSGLTSVKVDIEMPLSISSSTFSNRANATLIVPAGSKAAYEEADYWKDFKRIIEFVEGDVNSDGETDVVDVVEIARFVVGTPAETFVEILADINYDGSVNIGDAVALVNEIAGDQNFVKAMRAPSRAAESEDVLSLTQTDEGLALVLANQRDYTAFQFDLFVPDGTDVARMLLNAQRKQKHQLLYNKVEEGHYRVAALSTSNRTFQGNDGELLSFVVSGGGDVAIRDIHFFTADGGDYTFEALYMNYGAETGIGSTENEIVNGKSIYDLNGRKMVNGKLPQGIYIVNGRKVLIK